MFTEISTTRWVTVYHQFSDEQTARAYAAMLDGDELLALAEQTGIDLNSLEVSLLADVDQGRERSPSTGSYRRIGLVRSVCRAIELHPPVAAGRPVPSAGSFRFDECSLLP